MFDSELMDEESMDIGHNQRREMVKRLIIALDVSEPKIAEKIIESIGDSGLFYKIGLQLLTVGGIELAKKLEAKNKNIFLDYKLFDIGITVQRAMESILRYTHPSFITVHGDSHTIKSAAEVVQGTNTRILAVSVPTSWDREYLTELGYKFNLKNLVRKRTQLALDSGAHGIISSALEAGDLKREFGSDLLIVTPGIRLPTDSVDDQKRVSTPEAAIAAGADYLVMGRPITNAKDPSLAISNILQGMAKGNAARSLPFADIA